MMMQPTKTGKPLRQFEITAPQIRAVVKAFYSAVRRDPILSPVFANHIAADEWPAHEDKIAGFWCNAILREGSYAGNPMRVHMQAMDVEPEHFPVWLSLFDKVLNEQLPAHTARAFSALAHRIGNGFVFGLTNYRQPKDAPPILR